MHNICYFFLLFKTDRACVLQDVRTQTKVYEAHKRERSLREPYIKFYFFISS